MAAQEYPKRVEVGVVPDFTTLSTEDFGIEVSAVVMANKNLSNNNNHTVCHRGKKIL